MTYFDHLNHRHTEEPDLAPPAVHSAAPFSPFTQARPLPIAVVNAARVAQDAECLKAQLTQAGYIVVWDGGASSEMVQVTESYQDPVPPSQRERIAVEFTKTLLADKQVSALECLALGLHLADELIKKLNENG